MSDAPSVDGSFLISEDSLGTFAKVQVNSDVYGITPILKAAYWFTDQCYLLIEKNAAVLAVELRLKQDHSNTESLKTISGEFLNSVLDHAVRQKVIEETSAVRDSLLKKAFFEARAPLESDVIVSCEEHMPSPNQSFENDPLGIARRRW